MSSKVHEVKALLDNHLNELKRHDMILLSFRKSFKEVYQQIAQTNERKVDIPVLEQKIKKLHKEMGHLKMLNDDTVQTLSVTDNYIQKYLPVRV